MAKVVCPPGDEPQKVLLLAEYDIRHTLTMHIKASEPLSTVQTSNGPGFYSSTKPLLLAYRYACKERGPHSGKRLLVYHRFCSAQGAVLHACSCVCSKEQPTTCCFVDAERRASACISVLVTQQGNIHTRR